MKRVQIAVTDFALPVPRVGSIEVHSGYDLLPLAGDEAHSEAQAKRAGAIAGYQTEVKLSHSFERDNYTFIVSGRIDGLVEAGEVKKRKRAVGKGKKAASETEREPTESSIRSARIEEIKTTFDVHELAAKLQANPTTHPYCLQLQTYAYIYSLQNACLPDIAFHLVSYSTGIELDLPIPFDSSEYEKWLERRLEELVAEEKLRELERGRRERLGAVLRFPFEHPRSGQVDLIDTIQRVLPEGDALMVQAPTGLGKTAGVVFPMLKDALARGQKVIYVTPKNSQHSVAQDAVKRMQKDGHEVRALTLTAKTKVCFKGEPVCNPEQCEFAKDYYAKVHENDLPRKAADYVNMDADLFRDLGEKYEVCPFELSLDAMSYADIVIGDYNYAFSPYSMIGRFRDYRRDDMEKPNLVVDEAHNLPGRAVDYYSPSLSSGDAYACRERIDSLPLDLRMDGAALLQRCRAVITKYEPRGKNRQVQVSPDPTVFEEVNNALANYLNRYLQATPAPKPGDPVVSLCRTWAEFSRMLLVVKEETEKSLKKLATGSAEGAVAPRFFITASRDVDHVILKVTCCDAAPEIASCMEDFEHVVAFSATLKPFDYYRQLMGFPEDRVQFAEMESPFPRQQRKLLVIPQVSTKYSDREKNYKKIADAIQRIVAIKPGNYFVFFPSFAFQRRIFDLVQLPNVRLLQQEPGMSQIDVQKYMEALKEPGHPTVIFAVQGGVFAEGVDYPGEMLIGAVIVGPGLPGWDLEREMIREYYEQRFGNGFDYAYTYPAMARVVQAAGRVIRSQTDCGLIVLMDRRFTMPAYTQSMPRDWFEKSVTELVSSSIIGDISNFWQSKYSLKESK